MIRYKMIVSYDGSYFHGFQRQKNYASVQEELEVALQRILKMPITINGAGRTDSGVHAIAQVVHFDSENIMPIKNLRKLLNKFVYPHIYVKLIEIVDLSFHSRKSALKKEYHYYVSIGEFDPILANYKHFFHNRIDLKQITLAMSYVLGTHDFKSFSKNNRSFNTVRTIEVFDLIVTKDDLKFIIIGNGFLHNMVRIIIALMLKVGEGKIAAEEVLNIIKGRERKLVPYVAPAQGLYLYKVYY